MLALATLLAALALTLAALAGLAAASDFTALLLAALAPRPEWLLAALAAVGMFLALATRTLARRRARSRLAALAQSVALVAALVVLPALWRGRRPYETRTVSIRTPDGALLAATYCVPDGAPGYPAVVLAPGSAAAPRRLYNGVLDRLCREGIAVLSADKRGIGGSSGSYDRANNSSTETLELLGRDLATEWRWLAAQPGVDPRRCGYWGVSQAGWTIPVALVETPAASFAVLMSGPVATVSEENAFSELAGESDDPMGSREPRLPFDEIDRRLDAMPRHGFDPQPLLQRIDAPMLYVYGAWDNSIPVERSSARLRALAQGGKPFSTMILPEANHLLVVARGPHRAGVIDFAPGAWPVMIEWIRTGGASEGSPRGKRDGGA